jgi:Domain of unknown function (DUF4349)
MTMVDEDQLRSLLTEAGGTIDPPAAGPDRILAEAAATGHPNPVVRSIAPRTTRGRVTLVAAVIVPVVAGISLIGEGVTGPSHTQTVAGPSTVAPSIHRTSPGGIGSPSGTAQKGSTNSGRAFAPAPAPGIAAPTTGPASLPPGVVGPASLPPGVVGQSAKVETTGSVDLAIGGSLNPVVSKLTQLTLGEGGFVAKSQLQLGSPANVSASYGSLVLQVPQPSFSDLLNRVEQVGKVTSESSTSTDVTGQYVDLQARISALDSSRQQYLTILSKATSIGDILSVQSQLDTIQSQIEQLQGQLDLLNSQTSYATLTVSLSRQGHPVPPPPLPVSGLSKAWHDSVNGFTSAFEWLVGIAGRTLFVLILIALAVVVARWAWRASRRRLL